MSVVHCKRDKYDVLIDRTTKWGNPFVIGKHGDREEVLRRYKRWLLAKEQAGLRDQARAELRDKVLGCWCSPKSCHGDFLSEIADSDC